MKPKSVSGYGCYVKDIETTAKFYQDLGFTIVNKQPDRLQVRLNWFSVDFYAQDKEDKPEFKKEAGLMPRGSGIFINLSVDDVDQAYAYLVDKGYKLSSQPRDWPWGSREFVIRDPDGYKLVLFKRQKARNPAE